uniref:RNA helicase n=1 Tax=Glossina palpalis gambiensis TaxID=67801 RepID=A0A1B0BIM7_9MUSC
YLNNLQNQFQLFVIISSNLILKFIARSHKKKQTITTVYETTEKNPASSESNCRSTFANVKANNTIPNFFLDIKLLMSRKKWSSLQKPPLSRPVLGVVESMAFELMTPVQASAVPLLMSRKDVSAEAVTGSEKHEPFKCLYWK